MREEHFRPLSSKRKKVGVLVTDFRFFFVLERGVRVPRRLGGSALKIQKITKKGFVVLQTPYHEKTPNM